MCKDKQIKKLYRNFFFLLILLEKLEIFLKPFKIKTFLNRFFFSALLLKKIYSLKENIFEGFTKMLYNN